MGGFDNPMSSHTTPPKRIHAAKPVEFSRRETPTDPDVDRYFLLLHTPRLAAMKIRSPVASTPIRGDEEPVIFFPGSSRLKMGMLLLRISFMDPASRDQGTRIESCNLCCVQVSLRVHGEQNVGYFVGYFVGY